MSAYKVMNEYIQAFPAHIAQGLQIGENYTFKNVAKAVRNVVLTGLGGSGIGAEIVANYINRLLHVPVVLCKDYFLPGFVNEQTLVVICSYSGNTEETIYAMDEALRKNANIVCITSGGKISEMADAHHLDIIKIPSGMPPRACLGYSMVQILFALQYYNIINDDFKMELQKSIIFLNEEHDAIKKYAKKLAVKMKDKMPVIYADQHIAGVATRWRQQFNENSKILGWERIIPEMNHNELVGWRDNAENLVVLFLHTGLELDRVQKRFEINKNIVSKYTSHFLDVFASGDTYMEKALYLILLGDWISWFLAEQRSVDAVEVKVIDYLKGALNGQ